MICECAFCTFPNKRAAAAGLARACGPAAAGFGVMAMEDHDQALANLVHTVRLRLMGAEVAAHLGGLGLNVLEAKIERLALEGRARRAR